MKLPESEVELSVPVLGDVTLKYTWLIKKYARCVKKRDAFDSPTFDLNANGIRTRWNLSIRFWRTPEGKRVADPAVLCLNLVSCDIAEQRQARVRFEFGVLDARARHWDMCDTDNVVLNLHTTRDLLSVGHRDVRVGERCIGRGGDVHVVVKMTLTPTDDGDDLPRDLGRLLGEGDVTLRCGDGQEMRAYSVILGARSSAMRGTLPGDVVDVPDIDFETLQQVLRYAYTDRVEGLPAAAPALLAASEQFLLPGLKAMCERSLVETVTVHTATPLLAIADRFDCNALRHAAMAYHNNDRKASWTVMELMDAEPFGDAWDVGFGSSTSSNVESLASDSGVAGL